VFVEAHLLAALDLDHPGIVDDDLYRAILEAANGLEDAAIDVARGCGAGARVVWWTACRHVAGAVDGPRETERAAGAKNDARLS
jgi:hypothetical protein